MANLTIKLEEDQIQQFQEAAQHMGFTVEELVRLSVGEYLSRSSRFEKVVDAVLKKNDDLYRRLAQ
jgi:hypothetical protein